MPKARRTACVARRSASRPRNALGGRLTLPLVLWLGISVLAALRAAGAETRQITFTEAVAIALQENSLLARAENASALDRTNVAQATTHFLPDLRLGISGSQSYSRSYNPLTGTLESGSGESFRAGLSSSVVLFDGGANVANLRAARLTAEASDLETDRARQAVVFYVISGYLAMIEAQEQLRVREENLAAQEAQERFVQALVDGGERPVSDLYQQQSNVAAARLSLVEARRTLELSRVDLVQALQLDPAGDYRFVIPPLPDAVPQPSGRDLAAMLERAFAQRADLRAQAMQLEAAVQERRVAAAGRWPTLSLSADYGARYSGDGHGAFLEQLDQNRSGSVGFSVSMPLFDRLNTSQAIERARIAAENRELALRDLRQEVALQVRRAVLDRDAAMERYQAATARLLAAEKALDFTDQRYAAGAATLYEVTLARADYVAATSSSVSARYVLLWQERLLDYYVGDLDPAGRLAL